MSRPVLERIASCACGALKVRCLGEPAKVSLCHCFACQRRTGSTHSIAVFYPREKVAVDGEARRYVRLSDSGFDVAFNFCPTCGSNVFWEPARLPDRIGVALGAFADPTFPKPTQQVYEDCRHPWLSLDIYAVSDDVGPDRCEFTKAGASWPTAFGELVETVSQDDEPGCQSLRRKRAEFTDVRSYRDQICARLSAPDHAARRH